MKHPKIDQKTYVTERQALFEAELEQSKLFDTAILTYSTGALGVSLTFIHDVVPHIDRSSLGWLTAGWGILFVCLIFTVGSFQTSQLSIRRQRAILDDLRVGKNLRSQNNAYSKITNYLNIGAGVLFVIGLLCLAIFVRWNVEGT